MDWRQVKAMLDAITAILVMRAAAADLLSLADIRADDPWTAFGYVFDVVSSSASISLPCERLRPASVERSAQFHWTS